MGVSLLIASSVTWNWWRLSHLGRIKPEQRILHVVLLVAALNGWAKLAESNSRAAADHFADLASFTLPQFRLGPHWVTSEDVFWLLVVATLLALLLRRVAADRQEKNRLAGELEAARLVQRLLLADPASSSGPAGVETVYLPALEVGGDFYWTRTEADGGLVVVVGDVSGKGLKAAMLVSVAIGILRTVKSSSPAEILATMNEGLAGHTGGGFVTCCGARFDVSGRVTLANAGHPSPYADGGEVAAAAGLPLGIMPGILYDESVITGSRFTFVSDGVVEAENAQRNSSASTALARSAASPRKKSPTRPRPGARTTTSPW